MKARYIWRTRIGPFYIAEHEGRFHAMFGDSESLGSYANAQQAAEDLANGHTFFPSNGIDPSTLGIDDQVSEWERVLEL
jgi:hypothetical protein